ncbi:hypothetical protein [Rheinheimera sp. NSM]|uniref:hypothetical protein n=1 Tax=Rheinheimera sp. NSM TaxID=3457884 RepID=UPI0040353DA7
MLRKIIKRLNQIAPGEQPLFAVHLCSSSLTLVQLKETRIKLCKTINFSVGNWQPALLEALAVAPAHSRLHIILAADFYQLVQLDKPAVAAEEMLQALPWQVKDLVSIAPEDIVADYIDLPGNNTAQAKINVVVASLAWLKQLVNTVNNAGPAIVSIQPEEWLATELLPLSTQACMLVVHQPEQEVLIQIVRDGLLYFSRRTRGFSKLHLNSEADLRNGTLDRLQLELQRSMDYFESQLKQPPVRDIRLLMTAPQVMAELLNQSGFNRVEPLQPLPLAATLNDNELLRCWPAVAAVSAQIKGPAA